jgi:hypothetical protein
MYENGKTTHGKNISEIGRRGIKENDGGSEFKYNMHKNICKCHNVPPVQ